MHTKFEELNQSMRSQMKALFLFFNLCLIVKLDIISHVKHVCLLYYRCNGGFPEAAWEYIKEEGLVTGGQYNSMQVSDVSKCKIG
jgi:hypothetical protein